MPAFCLLIVGTAARCGYLAVRALRMKSKCPDNPENAEARENWHGLAVMSLAMAVCLIYVMVPHLVEIIHARGPAGR